MFQPPYTVQRCFCDVLSAPLLTQATFFLYQISGSPVPVSLEHPTTQMLDFEMGSSVLSKVDGISMVERPVGQVLFVGGSESHFSM